MPPRRPGWSPGAGHQVVPVRPLPPGWGPAPRPGWGPYTPPPIRRRPELGGVMALVLVTVVAARAAQAVAYALAQQGKPYRWAAEGPAAFDCSGLTWASWRAAGVSIPRTAAGQLAALPRIRGRLQPGDLLIYPSRGPSRRHVAMVVGPGRMIEALGRGVPVRSTSIRPGWLGAVRPGAGP